MDKYEKYVKGINFEKMPIEAKPVLIALGQYQNGEIIDQVCSYCESPIKIKGQVLKGETRPCAWVITCSCGKCNGTFRGL